jgi:hypothetical protein
LTVSGRSLLLANLVDKFPIESDLVASEHNYTGASSLPPKDGQSSVDGHLRDFTVPEFFSKFLYTKTWRKLENESHELTIHHLASDDEFARIEKETNVTISHDLGGRVIFIGGDDERAVQKVEQKLDVLLSFVVSFWLRESSFLLLATVSLADWVPEPTDCGTQTSLVHGELCRRSTARFLR